MKTTIPSPSRLRVLRLPLLLVLCFKLLAPMPVRAALNFVFEYPENTLYEDYPAAKPALEDAAATVGSWFQNTVTLRYTVLAVKLPVPANRLAEGEFAGYFDPSFPNDALVGPILRIQNRIPDTSVAGTLTVNLGDHWDYDDTVAADKYDFKTVVMHELIHSLGWLPAIGDDDDGHYQDTLPNRDGNQWGPFARLITDKNGAKVINPSTHVLDVTNWEANKDGGASPGNGLFFVGANAMAANGGQRVGLYTPATYIAGTSVAHLDTANPAFDGSLMVHEIHKGPGPRTLNVIERGVMTDLGYTMAAPTCNYALTPTSATVPATGGSFSFNVTVSGACSWTPTTGDSWITVTSGSDFGNGTVSYTAADNSSGPPPKRNDCRRRRSVHGQSGGRLSRHLGPALHRSVKERHGPYSISGSDLSHGRRLLPMDGHNLPVLDHPRERIGNGQRRCRLPDRRKQYRRAPGRCRHRQRAGAHHPSTGGRRLHDRVVSNFHRRAGSRGKIRIELFHDQHRGGLFRSATAVLDHHLRLHGQFQHHPRTGHDL